MQLQDIHHFISIYFTSSYMTSSLEIDTKSCHTNFSLFLGQRLAAVVIYHPGGSAEHLLMLWQKKQAEHLAILRQKQ